jgi:hypothetical protein
MGTVVINAYSIVLFLIPLRVWLGLRESLNSSRKARNTHMSATPDSDPNTPGHKVTLSALPDRLIRYHIQCSRRRQARRQTERRFLLRRLRSIIIDLDRNRAAGRDL